MAHGEIGRPLRIGLACESAADARQLQHLVDTLLLQGVDWLDAVPLDSVRSWVGLGDGASDHFDIHKVREEARRMGLKLHGKQSAPDERMVHNLLELFRRQPVPPDAVIVARDLDGDAARAVGIAAAIERAPWAFRVLPAIAHQELEAWHLAMWEAESDAERAAHATVRQRVGFDLTKQPESLTARRLEDKKDTKRVLNELCCGRPPHERWESLKVPSPVPPHWHGCGLAGFIEAVQTHLLPTLTRRGR